MQRRIRAICAKQNSQNALIEYNINKKSVPKLSTLFLYPCTHKCCHFLLKLSEHIFLLKKVTCLYHLSATLCCQFFVDDVKVKFVCAIVFHLYAPCNLFYVYILANNCAIYMATLKNNFNYFCKTLTICWQYFIIII